MLNDHLISRVLVLLGMGVIDDVQSAAFVTLQLSGMLGGRLLTLPVVQESFSQAAPNSIELHSLVYGQHHNDMHPELGGHACFLFHALKKAAVVV